MLKVIVCSTALFALMYALRKFCYFLFDISFPLGMAFCVIGTAGFILIGFAVDRSRTVRR